jgi:hypothetical protein
MAFSEASLCWKALVEIRGAHIDSPSPRPISAGYCVSLAADNEHVLPEGRVSPPHPTFAA